MLCCDICCFLCFYTVLFQDTTSELWWLSVVSERRSLQLYYALSCSTILACSHICNCVNSSYKWATFCCFRFCVFLHVFMPVRDGGIVHFGRLGGLIPLPVRPFVNTYTTWCAISVLSGQISMKLHMNIHHVSGAVLKWFLSSDVKVLTRPVIIFTFWHVEAYLFLNCDKLFVLWLALCVCSLVNLLVSTLPKWTILCWVLLAVEIALHVICHCCWWMYLLLAVPGYSLSTMSTVLRA